MKKKYVKRDYTSLTPIDVYKLVASGKLKKFPNHYLDMEAIKEISRYVILDIYHFTKEDICKKINQPFLSKNYMGGFARRFEYDTLGFVNYCFPEFNIKGWEMVKVKPEFWEDKKNQKEFMLYLFEKLNIDPNSKEDLRRVTARDIIKYGGSNALKKTDGYFSLIQTVTKDKFQEWEIIKIRAWDAEKAKTAVKWLVEKRLKLDKKAACNITVQDFKDNNLDGMLQKVFNHSILNALNATYGDIYYREGIRNIKLR